MSEAKRVPYADHIISLGNDGNATEQGNFQHLNANEGYVSSFNLSPPEWDYEPRYTDKEYHNEKMVATLSSQVIEDDSSRRTGDVAVYLYYVNAVGWIPTLIFVIAISAFVFCLSFPSNISPILKLVNPLTY